MSIKVGQRVMWNGNQMIVTATRRVRKGHTRIIDAEAFDAMSKQDQKEILAADKSLLFVFCPGFLVKTELLVPM